MFRIKLGETHYDNAVMIRELVRYERNKISERSIKRNHHHIQIKRLGGITSNHCAVWLNIPDGDLK